MILTCSGCDAPGHAFGVHPSPACASCLRVIDGTQTIGCTPCIDEVVRWAGTLVAAEDESYMAAVRDRLDRLQRGVL